MYGIESQLLGCRVMLHITPQMKVLVAVDPADFRFGIDGLDAPLPEVPGAGPVCRNGVRVPQSPRPTSVKVLVYDGQGFWLCQKHVSWGRFRWWPAAAASPQIRHCHSGCAPTGGSLAGNPSHTVAAPEWRPLCTHHRGHWATREELTASRPRYVVHCSPPMDRNPGTIRRSGHHAQDAGDHRRGFAAVGRDCWHVLVLRWARKIPG